MTNYDSTAGVVTSLLGRMFKFKKVMDVGCTEKAWLKAFKKNGAEGFGVCMTGHHVDFNEDGIRTQDIDFGSQRFTVQEKQDLAISIDFVEKFPPELVGRYLDDLINVSDVVLFSSQLPEVLSLTSETGRERAVSYWHKMFEERGFVALDCIRPQVWDSEDVLVEYRQSMILYVREKSLSQYPILLDFYLKKRECNILNIIHPKSYISSVRILQDKINALNEKVEKINRKPKRVLYAFYHGSGLPWAVIHKMTMHSNDDAYVMVPVDWFTWLRADKKDILMKFIDEGVFKGVYTYHMKLGMDASKCNTVEKCEQDIKQGMDNDLLNQFCDLNSFDEIYSNTDLHDSFGIYLAMNDICYSWNESGAGYFDLMGTSESAINFHHANNVAYRDTLLKYKTLLGEYQHQYIIMSPAGSKKFKISDKNVSIFDYEKSATELSSSDKNIIKKVFHIDKVPGIENMAIVLEQGPFESYEIYNKIDFIRNRFKSGRAYVLSGVQVMQDYYTPQNVKSCIKLHPEMPYDRDIERCFDGTYVYHNMFTMTFMYCLDDEYRNPKYVVHNGFTSARKSFSDSARQICCPGVASIHVFCHKNYVVLAVLNEINMLSYQIEKMFHDIGEEGEYHGYNKRKFSVDIQSMIDVQFPHTPKQLKSNFVILQTERNAILSEVMSHEFIIYTDLWETLTLDMLQEIFGQVDGGIIKISKRAIKKCEDILVPLQDEYIFFFSKDSSYLDRLKDFSVTKTNKAMGIELTANVISMEEYEKIKHAV